MMPIDPSKLPTPILVTGAHGQLGSELLTKLGDRAIAAGRDVLDLSDTSSIDRAMQAHQPAWVINCAAYTAVDLAEDEADKCFQINSNAVGHLAKACNDVGAKLCQISTDYVFGQAERQSWTETDSVHPQGVYAKSKLEGECESAIAEHYLIVRTCGLYSGGPSKKNFVETMLRLAESRDELSIVNDQTCTPSYARDIADAILHLIAQNESGLFHAVNQGQTTWFDFAAEIFEKASKKMTLHPISTEQFGAKAPRPSCSVLNTEKLSATGCTLPTWQEAVSQYLEDRKSL